MLVTMYSLEQLPLGLQTLRQKFEDDKTTENANAHDDAVIKFRKEFELPCWPYNSKDPDGFDYMDHFCEFLRDLTVIYYDDGVSKDGGKNVAGAILPYDFDYYSQLERGIMCYRHRVYLYRTCKDDDLLYTPMTWPYDDPKGGYLRNKIESNTITKDNLAWAELNVDCVLKDICPGLRYIQIDPKYKSSNTRKMSVKRDTSKFTPPKTIKEEIKNDS